MPPRLDSVAAVGEPAARVVCSSIAQHGAPTQPPVRRIAAPAHCASTPGRLSPIPSLGGRSRQQQRCRSSSPAYVKIPQRGVRLPSPARSTYQPAAVLVISARRERRVPRDRTRRCLGAAVVHKHHQSSVESCSTHYAESSLLPRNSAVFERSILTARAMRESSSLAHHAQAATQVLRSGIFDGAAPAIRIRDTLANNPACGPIVLVNDKTDRYHVAHTETARRNDAFIRPDTGIPTPDTGPVAH